MLGFIFCHGWGYDPSFWNNLKPYFKNHPCIFWDLGYFNSSDLRETEISSIKWVGIGHSLGFLKLLNCSIDWYKLVGLQGFINFQGNSSSLNKKRSRDFLRLQNNFEVDPNTTLSNFHKICGNMRPAYSKINKQTMLDDLVFLNTIYTLKKHCLIIGSDDDLIVTKELIEDNFAQYMQVKIVMHNKGLHNLGFNEPEFVKNTIFDFVNVK